MSFIPFDLNFSKYCSIKLKIISRSSFIEYFGKEISMSADENQFQGKYLFLALSCLVSTL
jgi:hypothetical protein